MPIKTHVTNYERHRGEAVFDFVRRVTNKGKKRLAALTDNENAQEHLDRSTNFNELVALEKNDESITGIAAAVYRTNREPRKRGGFHVVELEYACRLDGIFLFRFKLQDRREISNTKQKHDVGDRQEPVEALNDEKVFGAIQINVARFLNDIIKRRLNHVHDFNDGSDTHNSHLTSDPVRIAMSLDTCCSLETLRNISGVDELEAGSDGKYLDAARDQQLAHTARQLVLTETTDTLPLVEVVSSDKMMASLAAYRRPRDPNKNPDRNELRGPQPALLRYRENLSLARRRCLISVKTIKDWDRGVVSLFSVTNAFIWIVIISFSIDSFFHLYNSSDKKELIKLLPIVIPAYILCCLFLFGLQYYQENEVKINTVIKDKRFKIFIVLFLIFCFILYHHIGQHAFIEFLERVYRPIDDRVLSVYENWRNEVRDRWSFEAKSVLLILGFLFVVKSTVGRQNQLKPIMKVIRHTVGFFSHVNVYCRAVNSIYENLEKRNALEMRINHVYADFSDIIMSLEKKHQGHQIEYQWLHNRYVILAATVAALFAFIEWSWPREDGREAQAQSVQFTVSGQQCELTVEQLSVLRPDGAEKLVVSLDACSPK